jgi:hypothetical protein
MTKGESRTASSFGDNVPVDAGATWAEATCIKAKNKPAHRTQLAQFTVSFMG